MNIHTKFPIMVFRNEYNDKASYSTTISNKKEDGTYENAFISLNLPKGTELADRTKIQIKNGFLSFYKKGEEGNQSIVFKVIVTDYEIVELGEAKVEKQEDNTSDPFVEFGNEVVLSDDELPF